MGSVLHPVGTQAPGVYWGRRLLVLVVLAALVGALVWWLLPRPETAVVADPVTGSSVQPPTSAAPPPSSASASPDTSASAKPTGPQACDPASVRLTVAGFQRVKVSTKQVFTLSVINGGTEPCVLTISPSTYSLTVKSGNDRIWSTADCKKWLPEATVTVKPETAHEFQVTWPLRRSSEDCKTGKDKLRAGTYVATVTLLEKATARQVMQLV